jgi:16S rRNA (cytidine1402-2'-O)-methyltransferase
MLSFLILPRPLRASEWSLLQGESVHPALYVVATPIGNLGDISRRALEVLQGVDLIAAEDTRHSQRLLQHFTIRTPVCAYHDHSDTRDSERILRCLQEGGSVALISDAGTPLISDPGYRLVRQAQDAGHRVCPVPGACAVTAALSVSGLPTDRFLFEGFLPARAGARLHRLEALRRETATMIFYEAPHRVRDSVDAMVTAFGPRREAVIARELSKTFETVERAELGQLLAFIAGDSNQQKGEIVLLVAGDREHPGQLDEQATRLLERLAQELPAKRAAAVVAELTGLRKKLLYEHLVLSRKE